jgi:hypothetical protein
MIDPRSAFRTRISRITGGGAGAVEEPPNKRFDTDPQQQRFAPLFRAGQSRRWASP